MKLGRLEKLDLRSYWKKEDTEFTPWLAKEENIRLLGDTIGLDLEVQSQEESVGPFRADILCRETTNDHYVLIENQLEKTDHTHLGQLMTYAAGLDTVTIIWIAQKFSEEHRAALDWLNRITDDTFNFFGIEIELYRIGDSPAAPMFNMVSKPNNWAKSVRKTASSQNITETKLLQQQYWGELKAYLEEKRCIGKLQSPQPQHWTNVSIGKSDFHISLTVNSREKLLSIWLNITGDQAKENFDKLYAIAYEASLVEVSRDIIWAKMEGKKMSCIILKTSSDFTAQSQWPGQFAWFKENLEKFIRCFRQRIKEL
mgnify:CR=1 FL=1